MAAPPFSVPEFVPQQQISRGLLTLYQPSGNLLGCALKCGFGNFPAARLHRATQSTAHETVPKILLLSFSENHERFQKLIY